MQNNCKNTLIGEIASSVLSSSAIQCLLTKIKEKLDGPLKEEYNEVYLAGYIEGYLMGYFEGTLEIAERMMEAHWDKDFIAKVTALNPEIINQLAS